MKTEPSLAARTLRAVALAITLVSIVTIATIGYSAYVEYSAIVGKQADVSLGATQKGSETLLSLNGTVPNKGLYPVDLGIGFDATADGGVLSSAMLQPISVGVGSNQTVSESVSLDFLGTSNATLLATLLVNGSRIGLGYNLTIGLVPFATLSVAAIGGNETFGPVFGNLSVGLATQTPSKAGSSFTISLTFHDDNSLGVGGSYPAYLTLLQEGSQVANTSASEAVATPGEASTITLAGSTASALAPGEYLGQLHLIVEGTDVTVPVEVRVA